ncbi:alpha/beta fold hydrolase [Kribbella sp. CWNU-51]
MSDALKAVVDAQGPADGIIAHSLGAGAVSQAMRNGLTAQRLVFVSATKEFDHTIWLFERALGFGPKTRAAIHRRFERRFGLPVAEYDLATVFAGIRQLPPLLAIHDLDDRETPYLGSEELVTRWPDGRLELTDGLGHRKILGDPTVVAHAVGFLSVRTGSRHSI